MEGESDDIAAWVASEILPHEPTMRAWLAHRWRSAIEVDDVLQEAYCRIASLPSVDHIENGQAYFRRTLHAVATDVTRRASIKNNVSITENDWLNVLDDEPLADRTLEASQELQRVNSILSKLSFTCRRVIELRRIDGLSQRETAQQLGVTENVVENHIVRGLRKVLQELAIDEYESSEREVEPVGKS